MSKKKWTIETCTKEAQLYATRGDFYKHSCSAYVTSHRNGWLDQVCAHMEFVRCYWTLEKCAEVAKKYNTRGEFVKGNHKAYDAARHNGWLDDVCTHMVSGVGIWTIEECTKLAKKYETRMGFQRGNYSAYRSAYKHGWLDEICKHMHDGTSGFSFSQWSKNIKEARLYILHMTDGKEEFYKIGITSTSVKRRYSTTKTAYNMLILAEILDTPKSVWDMEREVLRHVKKIGEHYSPKHEFFGHTECFTPDALQPVFDLIYNEIGD